LWSYVQSYQQGEANPRPNWRIVRESPCTATRDGDGGLGIITMFNGRHLGAAGYHAMLAAQADMVRGALPFPDRA
jgi:LDH2 family malate/lactate/ureidoglycolate dehydrogenase